MMYEIGRGGLTACKSHNDLPAGTILHWGGNMGYAACDHAIVESDERGERTVYKTINLNTGKYSTVDGFHIKDPDDPNLRHGQYYFLTGKNLTPAELAERVNHADDLAYEEAAARDAKEQEDNRLLTKGEDLLRAHRPSWAKAAIVAIHDHDASDSMTDLFMHTRGERVIIGWSKHTKDLFSEMRKHAHKLPETRYLATKPTKPADASEWWTPEDEHREKYSMGGGYYLKAGGRHSTGWRIEKTMLNDDGMPGYEYIRAFARQTENHRLEPAEVNK